MNESTSLKSSLSPEEIRARYEAILAEGGMRARNAAEKIGVTEGELLAARVGSNIIRLKNDPEAILKEVEGLGEVIALTRNESCVHERKGVYLNASFFSHGPVRTGILVNPDIDLRLFMGNWKFAFAEMVPTENGTRKSLQFFDATGQAVHKIYLTNHSTEAAYDDLVAKYRDAEQTAGIEVADAAPPAEDLPDSEIDWDGFRAAWENLKDTHAFFPMLRKFKVGRVQALRKIGADFAAELDNTAARRVLELARDKEAEIMVFVGNKGCIQIHTGPVKKLVEMGDWYNVLDPKFNLHLNEAGISRSFVTRKPTADGIVTAVEVFDENDEMIMTFFGKRKPGAPENETWREIVDALPQKEMANVA
ncbi:MAG: hemin-degrading factor [Sneathiella sp.]|jgi:putative hemin transport protein|uniref:hemin-degrading factor n=1 Tax=Sneathiella sp. TaxID=1964365 RepID=UPI000C49001A|nr:ChuX/HutX family heme-like substrate-binding protein [Sneathiella sp.]MAL77937.1 hemin-degrading factor [Sneathiella sp.]